MKYGFFFFISVLALLLAKKMKSVRLITKVPFSFSVIFIITIARERHNLIVHPIPSFWRDLFK